MAFLFLKAFFTREWKNVLIVAIIGSIAYFSYHWYNTKIQEATKAGADAEYKVWKDRYVEAIARESEARMALTDKSEDLVREQQKNQRTVQVNVDREVIKTQTKLYADPACKARNGYTKDVNSIIKSGSNTVSPTVVTPTQPTYIDTQVPLGKQKVPQALKDNINSIIRGG